MFRHKTCYYSGTFTEEEIRVRTKVEEEVVPAIHVLMDKSNPRLYALYNRRCCKQLAFLLSIYLQEKLPGYTWIPLESKFEEEEGLDDEECLYDHAWVHGVHESDPSRNILIDYGKLENEYALWIQSRSQGYPKEFRIDDEDDWYFDNEEDSYRKVIQPVERESYTGLPSLLMYETLQTVLTVSEAAYRVHREIERVFDEFYGTCIEASKQLVQALLEKGIQSWIVEGWCVYDDFSGCSDAPYDAHAWVEVKIGEDIWFVDVTATQFANCINKRIPNVIIGKRPRYLQIKEPDEEQLAAMGWKG